MTPLERELRPYGFRRGNKTKWCAACGNEVPGLAPNAFKCERCAKAQNKEVIKCMRRFGMEID
jgi:predicted amidophosphoribosyltransferase